VEKPITWVALDTSKSEHVGAIVVGSDRDVREVRIRNEKRAIGRFARKLVREAPGEVRVCYEAGPCGYALMRELEAAAELVCEVVAPSLIPVRPGRRVKTDRLDARKLVGLYRAGELTMVHPPDAADESVRDLVRCREGACADLLRARHRLVKFLLRRGRVYRGGSAWTLKHRRWLSSQLWEEEMDRSVFEEYRLVVSEREERVTVLDQGVEEVSQREPYREPVGWLRCFRGIDTVIAMTILVEIHDFTRFASASALMGYLGLVPSEHSSADRIRRGGLTKAGNAHVRRVLIESAWSARHRPAVGPRVRIRREGQPAWVIAHADRAMRRLYRRYHRLVARGKPPTKVIGAIARELAGFVWAVLREGEQRRRELRA